MLEVELKSVVDDVPARRAAVEAAGGKLVYEGRLLDLRYDVPDRSLMMRDHVLRLRVYESANSRKVLLDWKGETRYEDGYKVREELSTPVDDPEMLRQIVERLGYVDKDNQPSNGPPVYVVVLPDNGRDDPQDE